MECPNDIDEIVMNKIYNSLVERYNSSNKEIDENEKKEIIQIFQDFKIENHPFSAFFQRLLLKRRKKIYKEVGKIEHNERFSKVFKKGESTEI